MLDLALLFVATTLNPQNDLGIQKFHPTRLIVKCDQKPSLPGFKTLRWMPQIKRAVVQSLRPLTAYSMDGVSRMPGVKAVERDRAAKIAYVPNDPRWTDQWNLRTMKVDLAWDRTLGSNSAIVAIMDTGVNTAHEDLVANLWQNSGEIAGNSIDDDGNGYVDDMNGYDFVGEDAIPEDVNGHGTACAGIAAAVGDNSIGVAGIAPKARIMCLKAAQDDGYFFLSNNLPAYLYAADMGAKVLSMSFFSDSLSPAEREAIDYVFSKGCLPIAASGNDSTVYSYYPAAYENTLSVAATVQSNAKAGFSDWGSWVDVAAPGVGISTTVTSGGYTTGFAGTSAACPNVAGVAALLFGARPDATVTQVRNAIEDTASTLTQSPFGEFSNYGLVDAQAALNALLDGNARRKSAVVRYVTPVGQDPTGVATARIYGRSLDGRMTITTSRNRLQTVAAGRDYRDVRLGPGTRSFTIFDRFNQIAEITAPVSNGLAYPLIEGASDGGGLVYGGFFETLENDRRNMRVTRRSNGTVMLEGTFRRLPGTGFTNLVLRRKYTGTVTGVERIQLYDWSSNSYPYGSFVDINVGALPTTWSKLDRPITNGQNFVDYEGTVYFRILTDAGQSAETELLLDFALLK